MIQMPSPELPRFCLMTRGWKAMVFLEGEASGDRFSLRGKQKQKGLPVGSEVFRKQKEKQKKTEIVQFFCCFSMLLLFCCSMIRPF